jgi:serine/threonine protein kinase
MIGTTISHYKILSKLGEGGMGVVYKAEDTKLDRTVALKFLPANAVGTEDEKARFVQEAKAAASLSHANIATVFGIDEHNGDMFIFVLTFV